MQNVQKSSNSTKKAGKAKRNLKIVVDYFYCARLECGFSKLKC